MCIKSKSSLALAGLVMMLCPTSTVASELKNQSPVTSIDLQTVRESGDKVKGRSHVKVLSDHPGSATALTSRQKSEIKEILAKGKSNKSFICTGASLAGQRESMYRVVLLRAQLVCDYAKSLRPSIQITVQEKITSARKFNGRVVVVSK
jgi:hypothetical protein